MSMIYALKKTSLVIENSILWMNDVVLYNTRVLSNWINKVFLIFLLMNISPNSLGFGLTQRPKSSYENITFIVITLFLPPTHLEKAYLKGVCAVVFLLFKMWIFHVQEENRKHLTTFLKWLKFALIQCLLFHNWLTFLTL